ncbi:unnamed protein product [Rhizoctonia solani]|uniref:Uncharacterized protein n=1 Tax=Rhizoctonia solani TaxID=456999 RepID=A0A8H2WTH5_9AGAM|nr:unnamed protein product [Rhizoctonia solani]CAE6526683.1 unnamed protein product [Rhizoctonia solani]
MAKIEVVPESDQDDHIEEDELGIPLTRPSDLGEIPHDEQMRLIKDTGILDQLPAKNAEQLAPLADSILDTGIIAIPLSTLYIVLDLLVQQQYAQQPTIKEEFGRVITNVPILCILIHYKASKQTQGNSDSSAFAFPDSDTGGTADDLVGEQGLLAARYSPSSSFGNNLDLHNYSAQPYSSRG